jgi:hypothetical protein
MRAMNIRIPTPLKKFVTRLLVCVAPLSKKRPGVQQLELFTNPERTHAPETSGVRQTKRSKTKRGEQSHLASFI